MKCSDVTVMSTWKAYTPLNCIKEPAQVDIEGYILPCLYSSSHILHHEYNSVSL